MMVVLKPRATWSAETAGRISSAEISMMPTTFMASTTVRAVRSTSTALMSSALIPDVSARSSSKVMANRSL